MKWLCLILLTRVLLAAEVGTVRGIVVDQNGDPISGVCLDHYGATYCNAMTDSMGRFEIRTGAPAVVFRKHAYAPQLVKLTPLATLRVIMSHADSAWPLCEQRCDNGLRGLFCFPRLKGVRTTKPGTDVDYSITSYRAHVGDTRAAIVHGKGPTWTLGIPEDRDVWDSVDYFERDYFSGSVLRVVDAGGRNLDGSHWRYLGIVGESASYKNLRDTAAMALLDRVLDSVCFRLR